MRIENKIIIEKPKRDEEIGSTRKREQTRSVPIQDNFTYSFLACSKVVIDLDKSDNNVQRRVLFLRKSMLDIYVDDKQLFPMHIHNDDIH